MDLITFYTLLPQQVQAWPARKETPAMEGAGIIHSDFKQKFINAEVIPYSELIKFNSWQEAHQKGKIRIEGREYLICDGDMIYFRHG
ncbi:MAG: DUF933 domain-containing protein [Candidatus Berkelbacteria bacterium]|nr:DUF933 domain-containing protein [Candidatus Berkelbacteria bacterium]